MDKPIVCHSYDLSNPTGAITVLGVVRRFPTALSSLVCLNDELRRTITIHHPTVSNHAQLFLNPVDQAKRVDAIGMDSGMGRGNMW
jgi:hypothetical protein